MISKKTRRSTRPVEFLEQFEISAKKGIDTTCTADKLDTVQELENLDVTLSGDLELRKPILRQPIVSLTGFKVRKILPLYNPDFRLYIVSPDDNTDLYRIRIVKVSTGTLCDITYEWSNYYTYEEYTSGLSAFENVAPSTNPIDWRYLELSHLSTSSVGTNAKVDLRSDMFKVGNEIVIHDPTLIPNDAMMYRDIQFTKERNTDAWHVKIVMPYMNTFSADTGRFDANYALDNPYAVRDEYDTHITAVKGALAYVECEPDSRGVPRMVHPGQDSGDVLRVSNVTAEFSLSFPIVAGTSTTAVSSAEDLDDKISDWRLTVVSVVYEGNTTKYTLSLSYHTNYLTRFMGVKSSTLYYHRSNEDSEYDFDQNVETSTGDIEDIGNHVHTFIVRASNSSMIYTSLSVGFIGTWTFATAVPTITVPQLIESVLDHRYYPVDSFNEAELRGSTPPYVYLKAFCSFNAGETDTYCGWERSRDGITWEHIPQFARSIVAEELATLYDSSGNVLEPDPEQTVSTVFYEYPKLDNPFGLGNTVVNIYDRADVCRTLLKELLGYQVRFRLVTVKQDNDTGIYKVQSTLGTAELFINWGPKTEVLYADTPIASSGKLLVHNTIEYTYGTPSVQPIIYASNAGEFVRPESKVIDIPAAAADTVNTLIPWRNYMIAATDASIHLITKADSGYYTKIVNSSIGIPKADSRCAVAVLNGIIFKSGNRIFQLYPNLYSGDDTILNISDISKQIAAEVFDSDSAFAFSTEEAYYLFLPTDTNTVCLKYNYSLRVWTKFTYPVVLEDYRVYSANNIRVFGMGATAESDVPVYGEFQIESPLTDHISEAPEGTQDNLLYGDYISAPLASISSLGIGTDVVTPIHYALDTGQKIDKLVYTKQFTEVKFVFNTMSDKDKFPCSVQVQVDGDPRVHTINVSSDSPFWGSADRFQNSNNTDDPILTLNVDSYSSESDLLNTFKQLIIRYSGKGRSVRFVLSGTSTYPFKLHSILSRYRTLNVKQ